MFNKEWVSGTSTSYEGEMLRDMLQQSFLLILKMFLLIISFQRYCFAFLFFDLYALFHHFDGRGNWTTALRLGRLGGLIFLLI